VEALPTLATVDKGVITDRVEMETQADVKTRTTPSIPTETWVQRFG
jgi:hypothetical protein